MENISIKLAYHIPTSRIIHIDEAEQGKNCNCECLECKEKLIAVKGEIREKHFRHDHNIHCAGSQESALHQLGKQIIIENNQIKLPEVGTIKYSNAVEEKKFLITRPDVTAVYNEQNIYFEIAASHFIENKKEEFLKTGQHKCVEINLNNADVSSYEKIKTLVLFETENKKLFGWQQLINSQQTDNNWIIAVAMGAFILFIANVFCGRKRHKRFYH